MLTASLTDLIFEIIRKLKRQSASTFLKEEGNKKKMEAAAHHAHQTPQPTHINLRQYAKVRELGKGSHGVCQVVRQITSGKLFVMKEVDLSGLDKKMQQSSMNESLVLCTMNHPNIIRYEGSAVTDSGRDREETALNILMEYAAGGDIYGRIAKQRGKGPIPEIQVVDWFIQTVLAVRYMHKLNILHRDIKSHNVFLTVDGVVKLGDFGICRVLDHTLANAHSFVGTPYYLSPELLQRKPYNHASDMWALGVLLCEMLVQGPPFQGHDMDALRKAILTGRYMQPSGTVYSKEIRALVSSLLQQNPKARPCAHRVLLNPYIRTRIQMWFEEGPTTLRVPKPPQWYLTEIRATGLLEDIVPNHANFHMAVKPLQAVDSNGGGAGVPPPLKQKPVCMALPPPIKKPSACGDALVADIPSVGLPKISARHGAQPPPPPPLPTCPVGEANVFRHGRRHFRGL